jgi:hypothetical protein
MPNEVKPAAIEAAVEDMVLKAEAHPPVQDMRSVEPARPVIVERRCRGRLGGSAFLLSLISRARYQGRRVIPIDGDTKSQTLMRHYPPGTVDGAVVPGAAGPVAFSAVMLEQMNLIAEDRVSRVIDVTGGGSEIEHFLDNLDLPAFCDDEGILLTSACMLGPDREDFNHLISAVETEKLIPSNMLIVFNEHLVPSGSNPLVEFSGILKSGAYQDLEKAGAKGMFIDRLFCMDVIREGNLDFYDVAYNGGHPATVQWRTKKWLTKNEERLTRLGILVRLP